MSGTSIIAQISMSLTEGENRRDGICPRLLTIACNVLYTDFTCSVSSSISEVYQLPINSYCILTLS